MTNNGQTLLRELGEAYVTAGYPERAGWYVTPQDQPGAVAFRELSAHGYVEPFCGGWRLTSSGLHAVMSANPMTDGAKGTLRAIREAYIQAGYPAREGWYVERTDAATLPHFLELQLSLIHI